MRPERLLFFYNTDVRNPKQEYYLREEVKRSARAGLHLYSLPFRSPMDGDGVTPDWAHMDRLLDRFIAADPKALFLLRLFPGPDWTWKAWKPWHETHVDDFARFADGSRGRVSMASDYLWEPSNVHLRGIIEHYENSPYGKRIIGWHPGAPDSELFHDAYRSKGPDYSKVNQARFRRWLKAKYGDDEALQRAWGRDDVRLDTAGIPAFAPGRFPMHGAGPDEMIQVFYDLPAERDWVDFSAYSNEIVAERIEDWARLIKEATGGRKLSAFFYGYTFELPGSFSGHGRLQRVLDCPDVDVLVSPYSYTDRAIGGSGNFMTVVDTVTAHGKLWLNEDDTRTSLIDLAVNPNPQFLLGGMAKNLHDTLGILDRNFGNMLIHRAGTWWMDLAAAGAFRGPEVWNLARERMPLLEELQQHPSAFVPEVAVIADEYGKEYVKSDWDAASLTLQSVSTDSMKTGVSVAFYSLADFLSGVVPPCRAYCFANTFTLTARQAERIRARLDREGAVALWAYAPGYVADHGFSIEAVERLVGMKLKQQDGRAESMGMGPLAGQAWGGNRTLSPRLVVDDSTAEFLGRYRADGLVSAAMKKTGRHTSLYFGGMGLSMPVLQWAFEYAGAHVWTRGGEVIETDGRLLMVHTGKMGPVTLYLPEGVTATAMYADTASPKTVQISLDMTAGETRWFRLAPGERGSDAARFTVPRPHG